MLKSELNTKEQLETKIKELEAQISILTSDIIQEKKIELELKESEEKYRNLFEKSHDPILLLDQNIFIDCNAEALNVLEFTDKTELFNIHPWDISPLYQPDGNLSSEKAKKIIEYAYLHGTVRFEWEYITKSGKKIEMEVSFTLIPISGKQVLYTVWRDISGRKLAERNLLRQKILFELTFNNIQDAIIITDSNGIINMHNRSTYKVFGYKTKELRGKSMDILYADNSTSYTAKINKHIEQHKTKANELFVEQYRHKNNRIFPGETYDVQLISHSGQQIGNLNIIRDISLRYETLSELVKAKEKAEESDKLKSAFLANMSHEIRTPMNGILGFAELLFNENLDAKKRRKFLEIIKISGNNLLTLINDIIDISKIEAKQIIINETKIYISYILQNVYNFFALSAREKNIILTYKKSNSTDEEIPIYTDSVKLQQILTNLIGNAIKFTEKGFVEFGANIIDNKTIEFYVTDSGIGIPENMHKIVFERFSQAENKNKKNYGGTGLGLAISKSYVEILGGSIKLNSTENVGTTFTFYIPNKTTKSVV